MSNSTSLFIDRHGAALLHRGLGVAAFVKYLFLAHAIELVIDSGIVLPAISGLPVPNLLSVYLILAFCLVANLLFILGYLPLLTGTVTSLGLVSVFALDIRLYGNHVYLIAVLVLIVALGLERDGRHWRLGALGINSIKLQLSVVYLYAALSKLNTFYLSGESLNNLWSKSSLLPLPDQYRVWWILSVPATFAVVLEAALALLVWIPRYRVPIFGCGVVFHCIVVTITPNPDFAVFTTVMLLCYLSFFVPIPQNGKNRAG